MITSGDVKALRDEMTAVHGVIAETVEKLKEWVPRGRSDREEYAKLVSAEAWTDLEGLAQDKLNESEAGLASLRQTQVHMLRTLRDLRRHRPTLAALPASLADMEKWAELRAGTLEILGKTAEDRQRVETVLEEMERIEPAEHMQEQVHRIENLASEMDRDAARYLSSQSAALFAQTVVIPLNIAGYQSPVVEPPPSVSSCTAEVTAVLEIVGALQSAFATRDLEAGVDLARQVSQRADAQISALSVLVASGDPAPAGPTDTWAEVSKLVREAFTLRAIGTWTEWTLQWGETAPGLRAWTWAAKHRRESTNRSWPPGVDVTGKVLEVNVTHKGRKAVSTARIETGEGAMAVIGIPYIKLDSTGVVPGAQIRARCRDAAPVEWYNAAPVFEIQRFSTREVLSDRTWFDALAARARRVFNSYPNDLAVEWTLMPGRDGAANPLRYGVWAEANISSRRPRWLAMN